LEVYHDPLSFSTFSIFWFVAGGCIILLLERVKVVLENKNNK